MAEARKITRALISVHDKTGIVDFARALHEEFGIELISTGGTAKVLRDAGLPVTLVEDITGFPEMLDGRVKTLHPKIHAAILADRDNPEHMRQLAEQGIEPIDLVAVNLYPFEQTVARPGCTFEEAIEMIDIGGPCLLRAAAKNHRHVLAVGDPRHYEIALALLREGQTKLDDPRRRTLALAVFWQTDGYDAAIAQWLASDPTTDGPRRRVLRLLLEARSSYGENPHQRGWLFAPAEASSALHLGRALVGDSAVEMSFNNYADASAALELCAELTRAAKGGGGSAKILFAPPPPAPRTGRTSARQRFTPICQETTTRRKLPHWQVPGATYFVTFLSEVGELSESERDITFNALRFWDGKKLDLHAAVVMRDHVHALLTPREDPATPGACHSLSQILQSIKAYTGRAISKGRGGVGRVWSTESHDRWIRSPDDFAEKWDYIAQNPVKEGLAATPEAYRWWYGVDFLGRGVGMAPSDPNRPPVLGGASLAGDSAEGTGKEDLCPTQAGTIPPVVCFIKHTNACGVAAARPTEDTPLARHEARVAAYRKAYLGDPNAAMGGILAVNFPVDAAFAAVVMETYARFGRPLKDAGAAHAPNGFFLEVWLAPHFTKDAVAVIRGAYDPATAQPEPGEPRLEPTADAPLPKRDWGQRVRLLAVGDLSVEPDPNELDFKRIAGGVLMQTRDLVGLNEDQWQVVTDRTPTEQELDDLRLAWLICKHTKSNAITICKDGMLIGNGAGQMSRVMSCRIATWLAKENGHEVLLKGAAAASDAFFPFRDGPDLLADAGVTAIIQPGGGKKDRRVIDACNQRGVAMIFTGTRHFRH